MTPFSPRSPSFPPGSTQAEVLWRDDNFTAYREKANPVSSKGHIIIAFNLHVPSVYSLSSTDLPCLPISETLPPDCSLPAPCVDPRHAFNLLAPRSPTRTPTNQFRIGFITPPFKDNKIPVTDHLHAHAYIGPADLAGWWRSVAYSPIAWYAIEDLIAEIRESVTNNRIKSGYENRVRAPIDLVPSAGARAGNADGVETTEAGIASIDSRLEDGEAPRTPLNTSPDPSHYLSPQSQIPHLRV
ncbi:hypothetical protein NLJ89_g2784 [Agrocybe chaxingu]|uniref:Uncharacterized protein n=1 Tax=Agrocybe chaxingu TaxID=84603 RepID=A0A9W8MW49_9AGAR|nr:hypothetical protein NLJ89_g2784 [Agrocybe chaxingu]